MTRRGPLTWYFVGGRGRFWTRQAPADELLDNRWSPVALCGRAWTVMADDFADHTGRVVARPEAPTCRQCLAVIDKAFPTPVPDSRIGVLAELAATAVNEHGTAEIVGVPGDQMNALRRAIRAELRQRFGFSTRTFTQDGLLVASSPETRHLIEQTAVRAMADLDLDDRTKVDDSGWRFHWTAWSLTTRPQVPSTGMPEFTRRGVASLAEWWSTDPADQRLPGP